MLSLYVEAKRPEYSVLDSTWSYMKRCIKHDYWQFWCQHYSWQTLTASPLSSSFIIWSHFCSENPCPGKRFICPEFFSAKSGHVTDTDQWDGNGSFSAEWAYHLFHRRKDFQVLEGPGAIDGFLSIELTSVLHLLIMLSVKTDKILFNLPYLNFSYMQTYQNTVARVAITSSSYGTSPRNILSRENTNRPKRGLHLSLGT